jgi:hypothetical protein
MSAGRLKPSCKSCNRLSVVASRFNITVEKIQQMLVEQNGVCAICKEGSIKNNLSVDHDHSCCNESARSCGKCVRGLLCASCNHGLGSFKDDPERLKQAIKYLGL